MPLAERFTTANPNASPNAAVDSEVLVFARLRCVFCRTADGEVGVSSGGEPLTWRNVFVVCRPCGESWDSDDPIAAETWARRDAEMDAYPTGPDLSKARYDLAAAKGEALMDEGFDAGVGTSAMIRRTLATAFAAIMPADQVERVTDFWVRTMVAEAVDFQRDTLRIEERPEPPPPREPPPSPKASATHAEHMRKIAAWQERQPVPSGRTREWTTDVPLASATTAPTEPGLLVIRNKSRVIVHIETCENINEAAQRLASTDIKKNAFAWNLLLGAPLASETAMRSKARSQFRAQALTFEWIHFSTLDGLADTVQQQLDSWGYNLKVTNE